MTPRLLLATPFLLACAACPALAEVTADEMAAISIPDTLDTPIGTLEFFDGVPVGDTIDKVYDNLDRMRAMAVFLDNQGAASLRAMRTGNVNRPGFTGGSRVSMDGAYGKRHESEPVPA